MVVIGEKFPEVEVNTTHGKMKLPDHFAGKWFVLFSHPADFTPVCTTEFYAMQKRLDKFKELGVEVIGLSVDQVFAHLKWIEWIKDNLGEEIQFPVIADDRGDLADMLGMIPTGSTQTARAVFIVDPKGTIRAIVYYPAELGRDWDEILRAVKALQISDANGVAMPHKWPNNELIKDRVIVPPAGSVDAIKDREEAKKKGEIECYDWWLCHKSL
ncbi:peroxiredoxin [Candidatus Aciduliprofundum boonei]|uniref:Peroxiredoxin n=1 Tax=Aciduliprofundum boonei (strain DSM 19572 / T469) TaxID=439481 RepID=B5IGW8_ACIB4|nr:peroxiredoxin [Candidatus Aciduliprofundum boonei]ADD08692.1 Peroxiredoxin [Aciduliprofundum boonei T469]EDY34464.1 Redoxin superfamily [Aciduliprofundum boonei T469]HII54875.1 peroxiredoxin [Candidatus Aciduliprofundum boonei]